MSEFSNQPQAYKLDISEENTQNNDKDDDQYKNMEKLILKSNKLGMQYLQLEKKNDSLELLKKAEKLLICEYNQYTLNLRINRLLAITYNNLGCYYRKDEKPNVALNYLKKALMIEVYSIHDSSTIASTHLNICAIFSRLNKHEFAAEHAKIAIELLDLAKNSIIKKEEVNEMNNQLQNERDKVVQKKLKQKLKNFKDIMTMLVISYYNLGIEQEYLKQFDQSLSTYQAGYQIAYQELGQSHKLTSSYLDNIQKLQNAKQSKEQKEFAKIEKRQRQMEEGFHYFIKKHVKIESQVRQIQANKFFQETYCQRIYPPKTSQTKSRNTSSISPHSRTNNKFQQEEILKTIDNPLTNLQTNNTLQRAQTVLKSRNDTLFTPQRRRMNVKSTDQDHSGNARFITNNSHTIYQESLQKEKEKANTTLDPYLSLLNRTTLKPLKNVNNNNNGYNNNELIQPMRKTEKLPSLHNAYDPKYISNENTNILAQNSQIQKNNHVKYNDTPSSKLQKKFITLRQNDLFIQDQTIENSKTIEFSKTIQQSETIQQSNVIHQNKIIDNEYQGYRILNNHTRNTKFSEYCKIDQLKSRSNTVNLRDQRVKQNQNTFDFSQQNNTTDHISFDRNQHQGVQNYRNNISSIKNEGSDQLNINKINIPINKNNLNDRNNVNNKSNVNERNNVNNRIQQTLSPQQNTIYGQNYDKKVRTEQQDVDSLQGQVRKSLNFNENSFSCFENNKQIDERETMIQECIDKLVDIYQNQSIVSADISQNNIHSPLHLLQNNTTNNNDNHKIKNELSVREMLDNYFKEYDQKQHRFNNTTSNIKQKQLDNVQNKINTNNTSEQLTPYLQSQFSSNTIKKENIHIKRMSQTPQKPLRISPSLFQTNQQQKQSKQDSELVLYGNSERNSQNKQSKDCTPRQKNCFQNHPEQLYDVPHLTIQNKYLIRPDSHQEYGIDLGKRHKAKMNKLLVIEDNIQFLQKRHGEVGLVQPQTNKNEIKQPNTTPRNASVNSRKNRQNSTLTNESILQEQIIDNENTKNIRPLLKNKQLNNTMKETNETQANISQILNKDNFQIQIEKQIDKEQELQQQNNNQK